ncbi:MAG: transposase [Verrucomicrobiota bacterium]|jgi:IS1 family transposase
MVQRFQCLRCGKSFSAAQPLDDLRIDHDKAVQIIKLLTEGVGVRGTARLVNCIPNTVLNVLATVGQKCDAFHDRVVRNLTIGSLQIDELWARVGASQRQTIKSHVERGDQYTYLAVTAREKFIVSYHTGKRDFDNTDTFIADVAARIAGRIQITTDSWRSYPFIIRKYLLERLDFATMQKIYETPLNERVEAQRRYSPPRCTGVRVRIRAGAPRADRISTSFVERANLSVRHFNKRFARLGLGYSRKLTNHRHAVSLFVAAYNFCKIHHTLGTTPAHGVGLTDRAWTIEELIDNATSQ